MARFVALALFASLVASSTSAHAECALFEPTLLPSPTEVLPAHPRLFYFRNERVEDTEIVASAPYTVVRQERFGELLFDVLQFDVADGELRVQVGSRPELRYFVSPHWREPASERRGGLASYFEHRWACAHSIGWLVTPCSEAPAFEIEWDGGHVVLPAYRGSLPSRRGPSCTRALLVGDHGCEGPVVDVLPDADSFRVFALSPSGERRPAGVFKRGRRPWEPKRAPPKKRLARRVEPPSGLGASLLVCSAFVALALVCRRRRSAWAIRGTLGDSRRRSDVRGVVGLGLVLSFVGATHAVAECRIPRLHLAPTHDEKLPPRPVMRLFRYDDVIEEHVWASAPYEVVASERFGVLTVDTLRFEIDEGELVVRLGSEEPLRYVVSEAWRRPAQVRVGGPAERVANGVGCSFELGVVLTPRSFAPAFDVSWAGGHVVLPAVRYQEAGVPRLLVGHHDCRGFVVEPAVQKQTTFRVTALFADGGRAEAGTFSVGARPFDPPPTALGRKALFVPNGGAAQRLATCGAMVALALIAWVWRRRRVLHGA